ncbi:hypothetical protein HN51_035299 [Arachis hypogaea]
MAAAEAFFFKNSHRVAAGLATARKIKERRCRLSWVAVDLNHQLLVRTALTQVDLSKVDRKRTPWLVVLFHVPWNDDDESVKTDNFWITSLVSSRCVDDKSHELRSMLMTP